MQPQSLQDMLDTGQVKPLSWLWPRWLPNGMLSLLVGYIGSGKTAFALDLAERIIRGTTFPDQALVPRPGSSVVFVSTAGSSRPRFHYAGLHLIEPNREYLELGLAGFRPSLIIVDSLAAILLPDENNPPAIRQALAHLNHLAREFDCAMLLIYHLQLGRGWEEMPVEVYEASHNILGLSIVHTRLRLEVLKTSLAACPQPIYGDLP